MTNRYAIFAGYGQEAGALRYIRKEAAATGTHIRLIHGRNLPTPGTGRLRSQMRPMVTSVNASTKRAAIMMVPTTPADTPITSV